MAHKQHVNKKENVEINNSASSVGQEKYMKYVSFLWPPLDAVLSIFNVTLFAKSIFLEQSNKHKKGDCHQCQIISFLKVSIWKRPVR
jgi:hypothetical protein